MTNRIKQFLENNFLFQFGGDITEDTNLFTAGLIDSFGFIELTNFLEREYNIKYASEELLSNSFTTLNKIIDTVVRKQQ